MPFNSKFILKVLVWNPDRTQKAIHTSYWINEKMARKYGKKIWDHYQKTSPVPLLDFTIYEPGGINVLFHHRNF